MLRLKDRLPVELRLHRFYMRSGGTANEGGGCDRSIGSTISDAIVRSWLWSTATGIPQWATSLYYCKQLIIDPTIWGSIFSTGRLLAIEDFTFLLQWMSCGRSSSRSNSGRSRWKLTEQTVIRVLNNLVQHTKTSNTTLMNETVVLMLQM